MVKYPMLIQWSEKDNCYLVGRPNFLGQTWRTHGETYAEAVANGVEVLELLIEDYKLSGERVGIYGVGPHWLKHSGATHQLINGTPIHLQQQELGHSGLDITSRYLHILPGEYGAQYTKVRLPF